MKTLKSKKTSFRRGFSLVELLTVIAIIGVLATVSIAAMSGVSGQSRVAVAKTNAQRIASTFNAGLAAGSAEFAAATDVGQAMNKVGSGDHGAGSLSSTTFRLPGISSTMDDGKPAEEQAKTYLSWNGTLLYNAAGDGGSSSGSSDNGGSFTPPSDWVLLNQSNITELIMGAAAAAQNPNVTLEQAIQWWNTNPAVPGMIILQGGNVYFDQDARQVQPSSGGYSSAT